MILTGRLGLEIDPRFKEIHKFNSARKYSCCNNQMCIIIREHINHRKLKEGLAPDSQIKSKVSEKLSVANLIESVYQSAGFYLTVRSKIQPFVTVSEQGIFSDNYNSLIYENIIINKFLNSFLTFGKRKPYANLSSANYLCIHEFYQ